MTIPTRVEKTEEAYLKRAQGRLNAFLDDYGLDWDLHKKEFLLWLEAYRETISKASWRQNRAALVWYMRSIAKEPELAGVIVDIGTFACKEASHTSAHKKKSLSLSDTEKLSQELMEAHGRHLERGGSDTDSIALNTLLYLAATEITGLRPSEWWCSKLYMPNDLDEQGNRIDKITLVVENGKATNGRSHGANRTLRFTDLSEEKRFVLLVHYRSVKGLPNKEAFDDYYKACKDRMTYTTKRLWPNRKKRPVLYSGRHQFSANLKQAHIPLKELAALMGHGTDETATSHYGKRRYGRGNEAGVEADPEEVARIREKAKPAFSFPSVEDSAPPAKQPTR